MHAHKFTGECNRHLNTCTSVKYTAAGGNLTLQTGCQSGIASFHSFFFCSESVTCVQSLDCQTVTTALKSQLSLKRQVKMINTFNWMKLHIPPFKPDIDMAFLWSQVCQRCTLALDQDIHAHKSQQRECPHHRYIVQTSNLNLYNTVFWFIGVLCLV